MATMECQKSELLLDLNSFQEPSELSGKMAWVKQIEHLLFITKGTYPSDPEMGIGLPMYDFAFTDNAISQLHDDITDQVRTYFPDMPFDSVVVFTQDHPLKAEKILIIIINFSDDMANIDTAVVAATKTNSRIDFDISI